SAIPSELLGVIIDDPEGDASGVDVTTVRAGADEAELTMEIDLAAGSAVDEMGGYVFLDVDQDPTTGLPAEAVSGLPTQDVGMEYFVDLFAIHDPEPVVLLIDVFTFEIVAVMPARLEGQTLGFDVPLEAIGGDDGFVNTAMVIGDFFQPTDWAPDEGHGTIEPFGDAPWMSSAPETGSIAQGQSAEIIVALGGSEVTAGTYTGKLVFLTSDPKNPSFTVDVTLTVALPDSFGSISGTITDAHDGTPLPANVTVTAETAAEEYVATAEAGADGTYTLFAPEGTWPGTVTLDGYVSQEIEVTVTRGVDTPGVDVALHAEQPHATVEGGPFTFVLTEGQTGDGAMTIGNPEGHAELTFEIGEVNMDAGATIAAAGAPSALPQGADPNARSTKDLGLGRGPDARAVHVPGEVLGSWPTTGADLPWGVGFDGDVWLTDAFEAGDACGFVGACTTHQFSTAGEPGTVLDSSWAEVFVGDMAYDAANGWLWQVHVGGANELFAIDPADGSIQATLTGSPWSDISQRGVAHDPGTDTFYVGGWNEGVIYQVAGTSHPTPGETLGSCAPADPAISGLAWNPAFSLLWMATNSEADTIYLIDPATCETLQALDHPEPGFNGAGLEIDTVGNLWTVSQNSATAYLIESGLPNFSDAPWLTVEPESGAVPIDGSAELSVQVDATGIEPGV
ncbi:MAG TPA: carboxypeptidase-like regulatory domain-containing protein, partial [Candidatus Limnocylindrales bacterium]